MSTDLPLSTTHGGTLCRPMEKDGKFLVWDVTCPDSFAPSYLVSSASGAGVGAKQAVHNKNLKHFTIQPTFHFVLVTIDTSRVFGPEASTF